MWSLSLFTTAFAGPYNIAPQATVSASSEGAGFPASRVNDGVIRIADKGCWKSESQVTFWGEINYPWVQLDWADEVSVDKVILYDIPQLDSHTAGGVLHFSDGSEVRVLQIPNDGAPCEVAFPVRTTRWLRFEATDGDGSGLGLSEIEVFPASDSFTDYVSHVDPYIETTRGRYFFFVTGSQPYGMIGAAPLTRNKNQDGGGYNYNSEYVLGFPQLHGWMLSGLELMPATADVDVLQGEEGWKSHFSHAGELVQPAYHRLFLDRYKVWVEQTAADRASLYRLTYTQDTDAMLVVNLGGYLSTTTMTNAHAEVTGERQISGYFDTTGRLWGGPDKVRVFFVLETSRPIEGVRAWADGVMLPDETEQIAASSIYTPRNEGMSYGDAPTSGLAVKFKMKAGEPLLVRSAVSYTGVDGAVRNLRADCPHWDFDALRRQSQKEWNEMLGRIAVEGGSPAQRIKFYTDLWHVLLGRHKVDDVDGHYPDYTSCERVDWKYVKGARLRVGQLPVGRDGKPLHHMYNSDAFWLSQWNLNTLWGVAYPEVLDDFAASLLQMSYDGGLLPRGPNVGAYSYIMSGCPATSLITSAYQRGLTHKWSPRKALEQMVLNHAPGGMLGFGDEDGLRFYIKNGYCPDKAGLTIQWAFEDWALAEMATAMGKKKIAERFRRRSAGWCKSFHPDVRLILPRRADGTWLHTNPLDGWGFEEANAWQATFGLSHDLDKLAQLMGGADSLCSRLDYAFRQSAKDNFLSGYGNGYVSYANQPGLSNAHVFGRVGKPWLTQYWVRRVKEQTYGGTTPDLGYGGHDEDQGQMGATSALMAIGMFSVNGGSQRNPVYDITAPVFDKVTIRLHSNYYAGRTFTIVVHDNSPENCYIQQLKWNGVAVNYPELSHSDFATGGQLDVWVGNEPCYNLLNMNNE